MANASFTGATFIEKASFDGTTFMKTASFTAATFTEKASFDRATFTNAASFTGVVFARAASFDGATFTEDAAFRRARFSESATLGGVVFSEHASFSKAKFHETAWFGGVTFTKTASFSRAIFASNAWFGDVTFTKTASFDGATFTENAWFSGATFTDTIGFGDVWVRGLDFTQARITGETRVMDTLGLRAETLTLSGAIIEAAVHLDLSAKTIVARRTRIARYSQLRMRCESADFADADLGEHCLLATLRAEPNSGTLTPLSNRRYGDQILRAKLDELMARLGDAIPVDAALVSLERAVVGGVTVSGLDLTQCRFHGAHGLDKLSIDPGCTFASSRDELVTPAPWLRPRLHTRRRIIADETLVPGLAKRRPPEHDSEGAPEEARTPGEVAETYRALRKSLEDAKNEPGAADFYYGEMQMRRRANDRGLTEHALVTLYWLVSGYGLRAGRALAALVFLMAIATGVFMHEPWATVTDSHYPADQPTSVELRPVLTPGRDLAIAGKVKVEKPSTRSLAFTEASLFSLRESVALIRPASDGRFRTTALGTFVDVVLRILGPVLIALAVLAIRARTKR